MLQKYISRKLAANVLIFVLGLLLIFHTLFLAGLLPDNVVWGGRAAGTGTQVVLMEIAAMVVSALMIVMVAIRVDYIKAPKLKDIAQTAMWVIFVFLLLNTIGNLSASTGLETFIFTPITILLAVFAYRLAMREQ